MAVLGAVWVREGCGWVVSAWGWWGRVREGCGWAVRAVGGGWGRLGAVGAVGAVGAGGAGGRAETAIKHYS